MKTTTLWPDVQMALKNLPNLGTSTAWENVVSDLAAQLPPSHWLGFEIRLSETQNMSSIDFHQGIVREANNPEFFLNPSLKIHKEIRQNLYEFSKQWQIEGSHLKNGIANIILEFDIDTNQNEHFTPSLFLTFDESLSNVARWTLTEEILPMFMISEVYLTNLKGCFMACQPNEYISHLGFMLSRNDSPFRVNVKNLHSNRLVQYFKTVGYDYSMVSLQTNHAKYARYADKITVCLDVAESIYPRIGLECSYAHLPTASTKYAYFLAKLVQNGLCSANLKHELGKWTGVTNLSDYIDDWSEDLLVDSLIQPNNHFSAFEKTISHIKIDCQPDGNTKAKAYIGCRHFWSDVNTQQSPPEPAIDSSKKDRDLAQAIEAAADFLLNSQNVGGWYADYSHCSFPASDEWITAYVGFALSVLPQTKFQQAGQLAFELLSHCKRPCGGIGWANYAASDADSTAWFLKLAYGLNQISHESTDSAIRFLRTHQEPNGGFQTYNYHNCTQLYDGAFSMANFYESMPCITAAVAHLEPFHTKALDFLKNTQKEDGRWVSMWWPDDEFTTALVVDALHQTQPSITKKTIAWAAQRISPDGAVISSYSKLHSALATASCMKILLADRHNHEEKIQASLQWLLSHQRADGSWPPSAYVYHYETMMIDDRAIHTTATVLLALNTYAQL